MPGLDVTGAPKQYLNTLTFTSNAELDRQEEEAILASRPVAEPADGLASYIRAVFERHKTGRLDIEQEMLKTMRRINRQYESDMLIAIRQVADPETYTGHTTQKCQDAEAWIIDTLNPEVDRTWDIEPSPIADIPPDIIAGIRENLQMQLVQEVLTYAAQGGEMPSREEIMQAYKDRQAKIEEDVKREAQKIAEERSANMEKKIQDQLDEGHWSDAFRAIVSDITRFKLCCLKGPIFRKKKALSWEQDKQTGRWKAVVSDQITIEFSRVSPLDWYPAPDSIRAGDGDEIELEHVNRADFQDLIGVPGYKSDVIKRLMGQYPTGFREMTVIDQARYLLEKQNSLGTTDLRKFDIVNFWGRVPGKLLLDWGMDAEKVPDPELDYEVNAKLIGNECIKAVLNPDPLNRHPYRTSSYRKSNDSQWGESPGEMMEALQKELNLAARALDKNLGWCGAPVFELSKDRCEIPGEVLEVWPGKTIISTDGQMMDGSPAVRIYDIPNKSAAILRVIEKLERIADDTVVPSYGSANKGGPAGKTAAGLSMLRSDSARKLKLAIQNIDMDITMPTIEQLFTYDMRFLDDESIKGDLHVEARGVASIMAKEQRSTRQNEHLITVIGNPILTEIHGKKGIAYMAAEAVKSIELDVDRAIPNYDAIEKEPAETMPGAPGNPMKPLPARGQALDVAGNPQGGTQAGLNAPTPESAG